MPKFARDCGRRLWNRSNVSAGDGLHRHLATLISAMAQSLEAFSLTSSRCAAHTSWLGRQSDSPTKKPNIWPQPEVQNLRS
jgi:hypothetical protein